MMTVNPSIHKWFQQKRITGPRMAQFIRDVMPFLTASPMLDPGQLNHRLEQMGYKNLNLDESILKMMVQGFEQSGLMGSKTVPPIEDVKGLNQLLEKLFHERGMDFRGYVKPSLARRIRLRMNASNTHSYQEYMDLLDQVPDEYGLLLDDLTVTVTRFFRNPEAFNAFREAIKIIGASKEKGQTIQIWSAGCATGQEPYSIAMLMAELFENGLDNNFCVLATDIDTKALEIAETGVFNTDALKDLPLELKEKYFFRTGNQRQNLFKIREDIKRKVIFERHNIISDPTFENQDIIVCRNVLIYLNQAVQMRVTNQFFKALNPGGYLLLGRYEMLLKEARRQFVGKDFDARLYRKKL